MRAALVMAVLAAVWIGGTDGLDTRDVDDAGRIDSKPVAVAPVGGEVDAVLAWTRRRPEPAVPAGLAGEGEPGGIHGAGRHPLQGSSSQAMVASVVCNEEYGWPWTCEWALATTFCESSWNAAAWATEVYAGQRWYFHSWWQIASRSPEPGPLASPLYSTQRAAEKYAAWQRGEVPDPWPGCP